MIDTDAQSRPQVDWTSWPDRSRPVALYDGLCRQVEPQDDKARRPGRRTESCDTAYDPAEIAGQSAAWHNSGFGLDRPLVRRPRARNDDRPSGPR